MLLTGKAMHFLIASPEGFVVPVVQSRKVKTNLREIAVLPAHVLRERAR